MLILGITLSWNSDGKFVKMGGGWNWFKVLFTDGVIVLSMLTLWASLPHLLVAVFLPQEKWTKWTVHKSK
jgi:hypothetical protein